MNKLNPIKFIGMIIYTLSLECVLFMFLYHVVSMMDTTLVVEDVTYNTLCILCIIVFLCVLNTIRNLFRKRIEETDTCDTLMPFFIMLSFGIILTILYA